MTWLALGAAALFAAAPASPLVLHLNVPALRQAPERCGPAALRMVLLYRGAPDSALTWADRAYEPRLRGALLTDLARSARQAGYPATLRALPPDTIPALLADGTPPILLYRAGAARLGPMHYGVVIGYDPARLEYEVNDGTGPTRVMGREDLETRWRAGGGWALIVGSRGASAEAARQ